MSDIKHSERTKYHVINRKTGETVGSYFNKTRARNEVDKRDNEYGGYAHFIKEHKHTPETYTEISTVLQDRLKN